MQHTQNYNFDLPEANDDLETATRTALDDNFTDLDTLLKDIEDDIDDIQDDISDLDAKTGDDIPFESGSADSISDKITILSNNVDDLSVDYIVEQGTSGIWTYEKWASGKAKCWGSFDYTTPSWSAWGSGYFTGNTPSKPYPFTFTRIDNVIPSINETPHVDTSIGIAGGQGTLSTSPTYYLIRPVSLAGTSTIPIGIYVVGRWK